MKLKTEKEIEDVIHNRLTETADQAPTPEDRENLMEMFDLLKYVGTKSYSQAQQDLLASASEGFEEFYHKVLGFRKPINCTDRTRKSRSLKVWQACSLHHAKKTQEKDAEIEALTKEKDAWKTMYLELRNRVAGG